jgi:phospholipase C
MGTDHRHAESRWAISRCQLLAAGAASGLGALAAGCGGGSAAKTVARSAAIRPAGSDLGAVEHVIFLMMENRSFDHYYGTYPGVRGFDDHPHGSLGAFSQPYPSNTSSAPAGRLLPFRLDTVATDLADCTFVGSGPSIGDGVIANLAARARPVRSKVRFRACWVTHCPEGLAVTPER